MEVGHGRKPVLNATIDLEGVNIGPGSCLCSHVAGNAYAVWAHDQTAVAWIKGRQNMEIDAKVFRFQGQDSEIQSCGVPFLE